MAEWLKAHAWKACLGETLTWVRIPLSPPEIRSGLLSTPQRIPGSDGCFLHVFICMGGAEECRLKLRCWQVNATIEHGAEEFAEGGSVGLRGRIPICDWAFREEPREHRADTVEAQDHPSFFGCRGYAFNQPRAERFEPGIDLGLLLAQILHLRDPGRHRQRISR